MSGALSVKIVFAGGGTGGHLYPALAIARRIDELLSEYGITEIIFVGTKRGLEYRIRENLGYPLHLINVRGWTRSLTLKNVLVPFVLLGALIKSYLLLRRFDPDVVVGTGGYVALPVLRAAAFRGLMTVIQEQNSYPGVTTRRLAPHARRIYLGFEEARSYLRTRAKVITTGNPVRPTIAAGDRLAAMAHFGLDAAKKTILVIGGSQGARALNRAVLKSLEAKRLPPQVQLLWQTGKRDYKEVAAAAGDKVANRALFPFVENMELVYAAADLVVARAGALTLAELAECGLPAVLVPYPHAAGDHQHKNARSFVAAGAAVQMDEAGLETRDLIDEAVSLLLSGNYAKMRKAAQALSRRHHPALDTIAEDIIALIHERKEHGNHR